VKAVKNSRAYAPLWTIAIGSILAGAVAIGHTWGDALITEVVTLVVSLLYFFVTGRDSDVGAIYGQRSDERQRDVRARASRLGFVAAILAAYACAAVSVATNQSYWQADVIASVGGVSFLLGIARYGAHDERTSTPYHGIMSSASPMDDLERGDESSTRGARELGDATDDA
jgi:hypothetical protein